MTIIITVILMVGFIGLLLFALYIRSKRKPFMDSTCPDKVKEPENKFERLEELIDKCLELLEGKKNGN